MERLVVGLNGGIANTVVFLKNISRGKAMDLPGGRQFLNQKTCRYEPHILLVPQNGKLQMMSSDPILHTVHMKGAANYNLPFPYPNQIISRPVRSPGVVDIKCNAGHIWMNAEILVVPHPYYAVTDEAGRFQITAVPPGEYEIEAWHEGWHLDHEETVYDVMTEQQIRRPVFTEPRAWEKKVTVSANADVKVDFAISEKY